MLRRSTGSTSTPALFIASIEANWIREPGESLIAKFSIRGLKASARWARFRSSGVTLIRCFVAASDGLQSTQPCTPCCRQNSSLSAASIKAGSHTMHSRSETPWLSHHPAEEAVWDADVNDAKEGSLHSVR